MFQKNDGRLRWKSVLLMLLLFPILSNAQKNGSDVERPKLVVGIMVDQMRWDYLHRYSSRYGEGGFKRLLREGFTCDNTYINYRSEEHTSELQSRENLVCRLLLEKKNITK